MYRHESTHSRPAQPISIPVRFRKRLSQRDQRIDRHDLPPDPLQRGHIGFPTQRNRFGADMARFCLQGWISASCIPGDRSFLIDRGTHRFNRPGQSANQSTRVNDRSVFHPDRPERAGDLDPLIGFPFVEQSDFVFESKSLVRFSRFMNGRQLGGTRGPP